MWNFFWWLGLNSCMPQLHFTLVKKRPWINIDLGFECNRCNICLVKKTKISETSMEICEGKAPLNEQAIALYCKFLYCWNTIKSISNIWQPFSCLIDERIPKICKKLIPHNGFLRFQQDWTANQAPAAFFACYRFVLKMKFLAHFCNPLRDHSK